MAKNFWNVDCVHCGQHLWLTVEDKDLGRMVEAICPKCKKQTPTTIGVSVVNAEEEPDIPLGVRQKVEALAEKLIGDPEIGNLVRSIHEDGFGFLFAIGIYECDGVKKFSMTPKVDKDGKIAVGTFTEDDEEAFRKAFRIKL